LRLWHSHNTILAAVFAVQVMAKHYPNSGETVEPIISIKNLFKTYDSGFKALNDINLQIYPGEIFALLGPNGAGKTTLISIICGIVNPTKGTVCADGHNVIKEYRAARSKIGLVPQELTTDAFESVWATVSFSRGLFGKAPDNDYLEKLLKQLSLWDKRNSKMRELSGGMKRRVMIAKALSHEPQILFLDEPTAGVDVELRRDMWEMVRELRQRGVTILLTTHYIEEAEEMADRIGVINSGEIILVEEKTALMQKLGKKHLQVQLQHPITELPGSLHDFDLQQSKDGYSLTYSFDVKQEDNGISALLERLASANLQVKDLHSSESSLEEIFVNLVKREPVTE